MTFRAVHEDRDGKENAADWHLAAGEDRTGSYAELMRASLTLPKLPRLIFVGGIAPATWANWLAIGIGPADQPEGVVGFLARHARDFR